MRERERTSRRTARQREAAVFVLALVASCGVGCSAQRVSFDEPKAMADWAGHAPTTAQTLPPTTVRTTPSIDSITVAVAPSPALASRNDARLSVRGIDPLVANNKPWPTQHRHERVRIRPIYSHWGRSF